MIHYNIPKWQNIELFFTVLTFLGYHIVFLSWSMFEATLQAKYEFTIILIFFIKKKKLIISTHEVVDGNPMMYKKTFIKLIFFIKKYRGTIKIHYNYTLQ